MSSRYSEEEWNEIKRVYKEKPTLDTIAELAEKYNRSPNSIRAKLSYERLYKKKVYLNKLGEIPIYKTDLLLKLHDLFTDTELDQLERLSKPLIKKLVKLITE